MFVYMSIAAKAAGPTKASIDQRSRLVAPAVTPVGLACPRDGPVLEEVEPVMVEVSLTDEPVEVGVPGAPVDCAAAVFPPVIGIWV